MKKTFAITIMMALVISGFAQQIHFDFAETIESGQTLYFLKGYYGPQDVMVTYPCYHDTIIYNSVGASTHITTYYYGFEEPSGDLVIPSTITHNDTVYTITTIGYNAFWKCTNITSLTLPNTLNAIIQGAFAGCTGISGEVTFPDAVTHLGADAFRTCTSLNSVVFNDSLKTIGSSAFKGCTSLEHISPFPESLTTIYHKAFYGCNHLTGAIVIPPLVTRIYEQAFYGSHITSLFLSDGVTHIERMAFAGCPITSLHMSSTVVSLYSGGQGSFYGCNKLESITVDEANPVFDSRNNCNALIETATNTLLLGGKNTVIPDGVVSIGIYAFYRCYDLKSIILPNSTQSLQAGAFALCDSLETIVLPSSISSVGDGALMCMGLRSITCKSSTPPTAYNSAWEYGYNNSFMNVNQDIPIYIPLGTTEYYRSAPGWDYFTNFIEEAPIIYTDFEPDTCQFITSNHDSDFVFDIDNDGSIDMVLSGYTHLGAVLIKITMSNGFQICRSNENTILNADTLTWFHSDDLSNGFPLDSYRKRYGFRKTGNEQYYYGWMEVYWDGVFVPDGKNIYVDRIAFCTISDYPLHWGQTCLNNIEFEGSEWYYEIKNDNGSTTYQHLAYAADTTINNERPKIIIRSNTHYDRDIWTEVTHEYVYESNGKVYWWNKELEVFTVLYDLTAEVGDEWEIHAGLESLTMHVDSVSFYQYEGTNYRTLHVSDENDLFSGDIVCGIGHMTSFFPEKLMNRGEGFNVEGLRCYWIDDELVYHEGEEDCNDIYTELHHGIDETIEETAFEVYPNPANNILTVAVRLPQCDSPTTGQTTYRITNLMGQTLLQGDINANEQTINIESLPAGMYFITIDGATQKFVVK